MAYTAYQDEYTAYGEGQNARGQLSKNFGKAVATGLALLAVSVAGIFGAAHYLKEDTATGPFIGPASSVPALRGHEAVAVLPHSQQPVLQVTLNANKLKQGLSYQFFNVCLKIVGTVPPDVSIWGTGGQLLITGNASNNDKFNVAVPEYQKWMGHAKMDVSPMPPYNVDPLVVVEGKTGQNVKITHPTGTIFSSQP